MASSARGESSNPYDGGLGTGGKFRKRPFRRSQTTPYDRPPTTVRNPSLAGGEGGANGNGGGWISKLVDPAQRLITYSAHRLFASVFRKRLPQAEAPLLQQQQVSENEVNQETEEGNSKDVRAFSVKNDIIQVEDTSASFDCSKMMVKDGFTDLEQILKQKTFTRSEIDRLTTLLRSKAVDSSTAKQEQRAEEINVKSLPSHDRDQGCTHIISMENGNQNNSVSTPIGCSRVLEERIASPVELAKAYMGCRPSEVSPSMLGLRGQTVREDSVLPSRSPFPSKAPTVSLVPRSSGKHVLPDNGFVTPRSRGRSAVYSMARTPYSRPQSTAKVLLPASQSTWEDSVPSGSRQGAQTSLNRRSSVLDNDMGTVGPVRRIRQKSNLLSRSLALPASGSQHASTSYQQVGPNFTHTSKESAEDIPGSSFNPVPSKSSEMASKILQQLDKLVSTKEKSPTKLSPSMLHGPALKSLQHVEAPKFLENLQEKKLGGLPGSSYQKDDQRKESGSQEVLALPEKPVNTVAKTAPKKDQDVGVNCTYLPATNSMEEHPPKKRAFRMSAHEDLAELDDDHDAASTPLVEVREKMNASKVENDTGISKVSGEKPLASSEVKPLATYISNGSTSHSTFNGIVETGKSTDIKFTAFASESVQQGDMGSDSISKFTKGAAREQSVISPAMFSSVQKIDSLKEPSKVAPIMPSVFSSSVVGNPLDQKSGAASDTESGKPSSFTFGTSEPLTKLPDSDKIVSNSASGAGSTTSGASSLNGSIFSFGATATSPTLHNGSPASNPFFPPKISDLSSTSSVSQSTSAIQSVAATPSTTTVFGNLPASTNKESNSGSISVSTSASNFSTAPLSKFGVSAASSVAASTVSSSTDQVSKETSVKDSIFGNLTSVPSTGIASTVPSTGSSTFVAQSSAVKSAPSGISGSSSPAIADAGSNIFSGSSAAGGSTSNTPITSSPAVGSGRTSIFGVTSSLASATGTSIFASNSAATTTSSIFGTLPALTSSASSLFGDTATSTGFTAGADTPAVSSQSQTSNIFGVANTQTSITGSGTTTTTQSAPFQFGSSASTATFGLSGNTSSASSSFPFGSSTTGSLLFGTGSTPQLGSSPSLTNSASSNSSTTSTVFGSNWQSSNSTPVFGSSLNSSSAAMFSFGGSSSSATGSSTTTPIFGSSASAPSSPSIFASNSTPATTPSQPVFGSSAPAVTPSQPVFGGSTTGFTFGATPPPTTNGSNNDQMSMEDSMAEDTDQTKTSVVPMFGQPAVSLPQPTFAFGAAATPPPSGANPFHFGNQQFAAAPQNPSPFQASSSLEFNGGGSFSLGSTGGDKSGRKIIRVNKNRRQKK